MRSLVLELCSGSHRTAVSECWQCLVRCGALCAWSCPPPPAPGGGDPFTPFCRKQRHKKIISLAERPPEGSVMGPMCVPIETTPGGMALQGHFICTNKETSRNSFQSCDSSSRGKQAPSIGVWGKYLERDCNIRELRYLWALADSPGQIWFPDVSFPV